MFKAIILKFFFIRIKIIVNLLVFLVLVWVIDVINRLVLIFGSTIQFSNDRALWFLIVSVLIMCQTLIYLIHYLIV